MSDLRSLGHVIGILLASLGVIMLLPLAADLISGNGQWPIFAFSAAVTAAFGLIVAISSASQATQTLTRRQSFLLTTLVWLVLPLFGALPMMLGPSGLTFTDAFFEAMSGFTTTGSTILTGIDALPEGIKLWRGLMQWIGGIGIIVVAMVFLPEMRVGGMQMFRSEGFETMGKILPRATEIAKQISIIYLGLTIANALAYSAAGMNPFDSAVHAMTTMANGGMANYDASFRDFGEAAHYVSATFMILASLPFVRYVQLVGGTSKPLMQDSQVRVFLAIIGVSVTVIALYLARFWHGFSEIAFRESLFNSVSVLTGTGYASADYEYWGPFPGTYFFFLGLIGGCAGSATCAIKVFRVQLLFTSIRTQIQRLHSPSGVFVPRYNGQPVGDDVLDSVMAYFVAFVLALGITAVLLGMTGLDFVTSISGAATAIANVGPGLGHEIGPSGTFTGLPTVSKWILSAAMLIGRLEVLVVLALFTAKFWRE